MRRILKNATIINEGLSFIGGIFVNDGVIADVFDYSLPEDCDREAALCCEGDEVMDLTGSYVAPGVIDTHVHFREPGATHKGCIATESTAAVAGGVTSFMDMPNNNPPATSAAALAAKFDIASRDSRANYGFYLGATDSNIDEVSAADVSGACAVKMFLGSTTGNLLLAGDVAMRRVFERSPLMIAAHCEDNAIISANLEKYKARYGDAIPFSAHPAIRSAEACMASTRRAVEMALATGARLHIMHVSTACELEYLSEVMRRTDRISAETCVQYLHFDDSDYELYGSRIKCNPAIKSASDRAALLDGVRSGIIKTVSTDHAPHLPSEKEGGYLQAASGIPLVQYSLQIMLEIVKKGDLALTTVIDRMCHAPARLYGVEGRGFIRKGCFADLVVFDMSRPSDVQPLSRCGWSPLTGFSTTIAYTFVNGIIAAADGVPATGAPHGMRLNYIR